MRDEEFMVKFRALVKEHYPDYRDTKLEIDAPWHNWDKNIGRLTDKTDSTAG